MQTGQCGQGPAYRHNFFKKINITYYEINIIYNQKSAILNLPRKDWNNTWY